MKFLVVLLLLLASYCMGIPSYAQYYSMPLDRGHTWMMEYYPPFGGPYISIVRSVTTLGDSIVGGRRYHVLTDGNLIREDTARKRIYGIPAETGRDTLLFDFNLQVGDTIFDWYTVCQFNGQVGCGTMDTQIAEPVTIRNEDRVTINGLSHRRLFLRAVGMPYPDAWIVEGIGTSAGLFHKINRLVDTTSNLFCLDGTVVNSQYTQCSPIIAIPDQEKDQPTVKMFISGGQRFLTIENFEALGQLNIEIRSIDGRSVIKASQYMQAPEPIALPDLPSSIYFLNLQTYRINFTKKIFIN